MRSASAISGSTGGYRYSVTERRTLRYSHKATTRPTSQARMVLNRAIISGSRHIGSGGGPSLNWLFTRFSESPRVSE
ncbi:hypothetical protein D3C78_1761830 [compost metagenome]